jgi:tetratricopeptide (TPR) repeat protein
MVADIFFASRLPELLELRRWAFEYGTGRVWVSEHSAEHLSSQLSSDPDSVRVACLRQVQASRYMICVFNGEYGSVIATERATTLGLEISLLELELITAVLTRIPTIVLLLGDVPADARTQDLWAILEHQKTVQIDPSIYSMQSIRDRLKELIDGMIGRAPIPKQFMTTVSQHRLTRLDNPLSRPDIQFLSNVHGFPRRADPDLIRDLTSSIGTETNQYDKLALLWMALRHCTPLDQSAPREYLVATSRALSGWVGVASWAGLHGHSYVGVLAGLNTIKVISEVVGRSRNEGRESVLSAVNGGLASEYYSSAKLMDNAQDRSVLLQRAIETIQAAIDNDESLDRVLPIKGSILIALGHRQEALSTFAEVLRLRLDNPNSSPAVIGEAEADLGWGYFRTGRAWKARELLEAGTTKLRDAGNIAFTVKQLRKLAVVAVTHNPIRAWEALTEAHDLATKHGLTDQMRQMEALPIVGRLLRRRRDKR